MVKVWVELSGHNHEGGATMIYCAGMVVWLEETTVCIVDGAGVIVRQGRASSDPAALTAFSGTYRTRWNG
jgi:hypothetical protein